MSFTERNDMPDQKWAHIGLTKKQVCFLDKISKDCKFSGGRKFSRTAILRSFLTAVKDLDIKVNKIKSEKALKREMLVAFE